MSECQLFLFADQTVDSGAYLTNISLQPALSKLLLPFFQSTTHSLKTHIQRLPHYERNAFRSFDSILDLASESSSREPSTVISTVLHCVAQLASLIISTESQPDLWKDDSEKYFAGVCTGSFAAAAAATSENKQEIIDITPEIIATAFYLGVEAARRSSIIEPETDTWARVVRCTEANYTREKLARFHHTKGIPCHKWAYISAESQHYNTISGPPSTLKLLFEDSENLSVTSVPIRITAAFHANHLPLPDIENKILQPACLRDKPLRNRNHILSPSTGNSYKGGTLHSVLQEALVDILQTPIQWNSLLVGIASSMRGLCVKMTAIGAPGGINLICDGLSSAGINWEKTNETQMDRSSQSEAIAVVGMSGRFPGGQDLEEFWDTLATGKDMHRSVPTDRFDVKDFLDPSGIKQNTSRTPFGCFIDNLGHFDANLFNVSPREAKQMDPTQRLLLMSAYEALEMAGYSDGRGGTVSTFIGQMSDDWRESNASGDIDLYYIPGTMRVFGPGRLQYFFGWDGPSYSVDTACSASMSSVNLACRALLAGDCDTSLAGGGNVMTGPQMTTGLSKGGFLASSGPCKTFDDAADGYCRGEGVGVVVLKRLSDAIADNDEIQGVIRSIGTNNSADAPSITQPHQNTQERLFKKVLRDACVPPSSVDYVELHGTGTQRGDVSEVSSVANICARGRASDSPLIIGSVKANVGHGEAAAGITSLVKSLLMFQKDTIPPHIGIKTQMNRRISPVDRESICVPASPLRFDPKPGGLRRILINNFNAAGGNTSLLLEDYQRHDPSADDPRSHHVVTLSAKTRFSLQQNKERLSSYLENQRQTSISNLSYSSTARHLHHGLRTAYSVEDVPDLIHQMDSDLSKTTIQPQSTGRPPVIFSFAGQGFRYIGIASQLFKTCPTFRNILEELNSLCEMLGFATCLEVLLDDKIKLEDIAPGTAHLALVCLELAIAKLWQTWGIEPDAVIGHSLGEYSALCIAGVLSIGDTLSLVGKRAAVMGELCSEGSHVMLAIGASEETVERHLMAEHSSSCVISCRNSEASTIVSGPTKDIKELGESLSSHKIKNTLIEVPYAFHSPQMDAILGPIEEFSIPIPFRKPAIPVISSLYGDVIRDEGRFGSTYLAQQTRQKVNFVGALEKYQSSDLYSPDTVWVDCGPGPGCLAFIQATVGELDARGIMSLRSGVDCWKTLTQGLVSLYNAGVDIQWGDYHKEYEPGLRLLQLPTYAFDLKKYWLPFNMPQRPDVMTLAGDSHSATSLQQVESDITGENGRHINFLSGSKANYPAYAVQGQGSFDGVAQCPISVWCDMAFNAANHVEFGKHEKMLGIEISGMKVTSPLTIGPENTVNTIIRTSCHFPAGSESLCISIESEKDGEKSRHADCTVQLNNIHRCMSEWGRVGFLLSSRMKYLQNPTNCSTICRLPGSMLYKGFSPLTNYDEKYRSIQEFSLDPDSSEGCGTVKFSSEARGSPRQNPYWIDVFVQFASLILHFNSSTQNNDKGVQYDLDGWESLRTVKDLSAEQSYSIYGRMKSSIESNITTGDIYLFEGDDIVASCFGISFLEITQTPSALPSTPRNHESDYDNNSFSGIQTPDSIENCNSLHETSSRKAVSENGSSSHQPFIDTSTNLEEKALEIISQEISTDVTELEEDTTFSDLGVDSLLSMSIVDKISRDAGLRLAASAFVSHPTVPSFLEHLRKDVLPGLDCEGRSKADGGLPRNNE